MKPLVSIIMGSTSDMEVMSKAAQLLDEFKSVSRSTHYQPTAPLKR